MSYASFLKERVFKTDEYLQFELLFSEFEHLAAKPRPSAIVERSYIYNGKSIFAGLAGGGATSIIDYRPVSGAKRAGYQASWLAESGFEYPDATLDIEDDGKRHAFSFERTECERLLLPNVLHHCRDFPAMLDGLIARMPRLDEIFIYDSYIRENHQEPDDFCRYTPSALLDVLEPRGFALVRKNEIGNVFDGILYLMSQAERLLAQPELGDLSEVLERARPLLRKYRGEEALRPLGRPYASFATAYAMMFNKRA